MDKCKYTFIIALKVEIQKYKYVMTIIKQQYLIMCFVLNLFGLYLTSEFKIKKTTYT